MPINTTLADVSSGLLLSTLILYALAMLCYACDFAFARHRVLAGVTEAESARTQVPALVGAGAGVAAGAVAGAGGPGAGGPATPVGPTGPVKADLYPADAADELSQPSRWPSGFWLRLAFGLTCIAWVLHVTAILTRGLAEHRVPWGNMYEFIGAFTCMAVLVLLASSIWYRAYYMGLFVLLPVVLALGIDLT